MLLISPDVYAVYNSICCNPMTRNVIIEYSQKNILLKTIIGKYSHEVLILTRQKK